MEVFMELKITLSIIFGAFMALLTETKDVKYTFEKTTLFSIGSLIGHLFLNFLINKWQIY
jgi:hypothetical protein